MNIRHHLLLLLALAFFARAQETPPPIPPSEPIVIQSPLTFTWDHPHPDPSVTGYKVYWGRESRTYVAFTPVAAPPVTIEVPWMSDSDVFYFAATATNSLHESDFSAEIAYQFPILPPKTNVVITITATLTLTNPPGDRFFSLCAKTNLADAWVPEAPITITAEWF